tara:strand:- start:267 stop:491 length:225 start_codon:yes stop_codon:yes gene_type:complete
MKTKNNLTTGILLGIGVIVLPLILMGTSYTTEKQNKFEVHVQQNIQNLGMHGFLLNTETGETWLLKNGKKTKHE